MTANSKNNSGEISRLPHMRRSLVATACVLALGGLAGTSATAQVTFTTYGLTFGAPSMPALVLDDYADWILVDQYNEGAGSAAAIPVIKGSDLNGGGVTPITVTNNFVKAIGGGNQNTSSAPLNNLRKTLTTDGIGLLASQVQGGDAGAPVAITATVTDSVVRITQTLRPAAKLVLSSNTLSASNTLNRSDSTVEGVLPASGYTSTQPGEINASFDGAAPQISSDSTGSVNIATHQTALNASAFAGSLASVSNGDVLLDLQTTTGGVLSSPLTVTSNTISATFGVNQSTNIFNAAAGPAAFTGSVAVTNAQANIEVPQVGVGTTGTATVEDSSVEANVRFRSGNSVTALTAPLVVSSNTISAASSGSVAGERTASGSILAGNAILFGAGNDIAGVAASGTGNNTLGVGTRTLTAGLNADLVLLSGQGNVDTAIISRVADGLVTVQADDINAGGSITANQNTVAASAQGNLAGNLIATEGANFAATVAAGNLQTNVATSVESYNGTAAGDAAGVIVGVGLIPGNLAGPTVVEGPVTASDNTLSSKAEGNVAATTVTLDATNLSVNPANFGGARSVTADSGNKLTTWGSATSSAGASATNVQGNYEGSAVRAELSGVVQFNATTTGAREAVNRVPVANTSITLENNLLDGMAAGNQASTSLALSGTTGSGHAHVGNSQFQGNGAVGAVVTDSGVTSESGGVSGSAVSVSSNTVASAAIANDGTNRLSGNFTNLTVGPGTYSGVPNAETTLAGAATSRAAFGIASSQYNMADVTADNLNNAPGGAFAAILAGVGSAGVTGSNLSTNNNAATATTTGNRVANTIAVEAANLTMVSNEAYPVAGLANLQVNAMPGAASASISGLIGIDFRHSVTAAGATASNLSVNDNEVVATTLGNTATNRVAVASTNFSHAASPVVTGALSSAATGVNSVKSDFALVNTQLDSAEGGRTATAETVNIGIQNTQLPSASRRPTISGSNLTVEGNKVTAEARNNNASNGLDLTGFATLSSTAGLVNQQQSDTAVGAIVGTSVGIGAPYVDTVGTSNLSVADNRALGLAVGNSASNSLNVAATNLSANATITAGSGGSSANSAAGTLTANADYGLTNLQSQTGVTSAAVDSTMAIGLHTLNLFLPAASGGAAVTGGTLSVTGNQAQAIAQGNSASNAGTLSGTNLTGLTGAVASEQISAGAVSAFAGTQAGGLSFAVQAASTGGTANTQVSTPISVTGNAMLASAGRNEAFNSLAVNATSLSGGTRGNNVSAYVPLPGSGVASTGVDFSVMNVQQATGDVAAEAQPGAIGALVGTINGASATVSNNDVTAKANVNYSSNALNVDAKSTLSASGAVNNVQTVAGGEVTAVVGATGTPVTVGIAPPVPAVGSVLNNTAASVSNNALTAQAGGNTSVNALNATAGSSLSNGGVSGSSSTSSLPAGASALSTFTVLNYQTNAASMVATAENMFIGVDARPQPPTGTAGSLNNTNASVLSNQVLASGYGNTASNSLNLSALTGNANQASAGISNVQYNTASITATVIGVTTGVFGGSATGGSIVVSGNGTTAQSMGNVATNRITSR